MWKLYFLICGTTSAWQYGLKSFFYILTKHPLDTKKWLPMTTNKHFIVEKEYKDTAYSQISLSTIYSVIVHQNCMWRHYSSQT